MRTLLLGIPGALGALLLITGCSSEQPAATARSPQPPPQAAVVQTLDCRAPIATSRKPQAGAVTLLGAVALQNARLQIRAGSDVPGGHVGKTGLQVRVGRAVAIRSTGAPHAAFLWGNTGAATFATTFRIPACKAPASAPHARWLVYPGLIATDGRGCLHLVVRSGDRQAELRIGAGAACP